MSDQTESTIFGSTPETPDKENQVASNQQEEKVAEAPQNNPYADLLSTITSEDGRPKYAKVEDALTSIPHAQKHIQTLEGELAQMREQIKELAMERNQAEERHLETPQPQQEAGFGEDQVVGLVDKVLSQREQKVAQQRNVQQVVESLTGKFGSTEAADKAYRAKANEMGISMDMMNSLAMSSPNAVLAYFGTTGASAPSKTEGSINTASIPSEPQRPKGNNPLLTGSMNDMKGEWDRIKKELGL